MRSLSICLAACTALVLAACGDDGTSTPIDAPDTAIDAAIDSATAQLSCQSYCTAVQANCSAAMNKQYNEMADCLGSCRFMPVGSPTDTQGNTLGCRTYHGGMPAQMEPTTHCVHAGPGGAGGCGMNCAGFCQIVLGSCTGNNTQYNGNMATCMTACAGFDDTVKYRAQQTGNNLACRLYHATVASASPANATTHCPHTGMVSVTCQ